MRKIERTIAPSDNTMDKVRQLIKRTNQKDIDFVNRLKDPNRKSITNWSNPKEISTHKMSWELFKDSDVVGTVQFTDDDCVRNPIIPYLLNKIKEIE